jgi:UDP-N-acetylmuramate dehydrogenase
VNVLDKIKQTCRTVLTGEPMSKHTYYKIGGPADMYAAPESVEELKNVIQICRQYKTDFFMLGNGSNILVSDNGFRGCVIDTSAKLKSISVSDGVISAEAGCTMNKIAKTALKYSLAGFEEFAGIPGTIGGALVMNAGCYGKEISEVVSEAEILDNGSIMTIKRPEMIFGYRESSLRSRIIVSAKIRLEKGIKQDIEEKMNQIQAKRKSSQPLHLPSCGSVFKRPEGHFAGRLIEDCGLKGKSIGGAMVSNMHAGFIVNSGGATASDVAELIRIIKDEVYNRTGVRLKEEVIYVGFSKEDLK